MTGKILSLEPVQFEYKEYPGKISYGLIAEEVEKILPSLVTYNESGEPESVMYHLLPVILLQIIKKQQSEIEKLKEFAGFE